MRVLLLFLFCISSLVSLPADDTLRLGPEEKEWISEHPLVRLAPDPAYPPLEYLEKGEYRGISSDLIKMLSEKIGIEIEVIQTASWSQALAMLRARKADMLGAATPTPQRREYLLFTEPFFRADVVILGTNDSPRNVGLEQLRGNRVGILSGYAEEDFLSLMLPYLNTVPYTSHAKALNDLSFGYIDYYICNIATASRVLDILNLGNIRVVGKSGFSHKLGFAVRKDWPILRDILEKALATVDKEDLDRVIEKQISLKYQEELISRKLLELVVLILILTIIVLMILLGTNRRLAFRLGEKSKELGLELEEKQRQALALKRSNTEKERLLHELHHRVNNNLQIVLSLIRFERSEVLTASLQRHFSRILSRIKAIALAQERGYTDIYLDHIDLLDYSRALLMSIKDFYGLDPADPITIEGDAVLCNLDSAVSFGILLNEIFYMLYFTNPDKLSMLKLEIRHVSSGHRLSLQLPGEGLERESFEGEEGSLSQAIVKSMVDMLAGSRSFSQSNNPPAAEWLCVFSCNPSGTEPAQPQSGRN